MLKIEKYSEGTIMGNRIIEGNGDFIPVRVGEELEVDIEGLGEKGDGIARVKGFVLFVPGTNVGEKVKIRVDKVLKKVGFAKPIEY